MSDDRRMLTQKEAAQIIGVSVHTLEMWRWQKTYPLPYLKIGTLVRYRMRDIDAFLETRRMPGVPEKPIGRGRNRRAA